MQMYMIICLIHHQFEYYLSQIQSMICLTASVIGLENQDAIQNQLDFWLRTYNMRYVNDALYDMKRGKSIAPIFHVTF
jgi:hypothetical protein